MASSKEISKTETNPTTEDEEGKDITEKEDEEKEDEDKDNDEATKSGKSKVKPSGDTSKSPGTVKATSSSKQKSSGTGKTTSASGEHSSGTKSGTAIARSTVKTTQEASIGTATSLLDSTRPPSTSIPTPTYITVPSTAGTPMYVYLVPYTESGETSASSELTSTISNITKDIASNVSHAVKSKVTCTLQSTCVSAKRSICAAMSKKEPPVEEPECPIQPECPPTMQEFCGDMRHKLCGVLTYDTLQDTWEKIWDGFMIMGGGTQRVRACRD